VKLLDQMRLRRNPARLSLDRHCQPPLPPEQLSTGHASMLRRTGGSRLTTFLGARAPETYSSSDTGATATYRHD
jgi:hypothetical protein